ncbi:PAS domain S-box protein [Thermodesulfobacteriota bacterium]
MSSSTTFMAETLTAVYEHLDEGIVVFTAQAQIEQCNSAFAVMLGYRRNELAGCHFNNLIEAKALGSKKAISKSIELLKRAAHNPRTTPLLHKDGHIITTRFQAFLQHDSHGTITRAIGITSAMMPSAQANLLSENLAVAEREKAFLENIIATSADGIMVTDSHGIITMANQAYATITGYTREELIGEATAILLPQDEKVYQQSIEYINKLFEEGMVINMATVWQKKDGSLIDVEMNSSLLKDSSGTITGAVGFVRDITQRKISESLLRKSEAKYFSLIEHANDAIVSIDDHYRVIGFNKKAEDIFGYTRNELLGQPVTILTPQEKKVSEQQLLESGDPLPMGKIFEIKWVHKDGSSIPLEMSLFDLHIENEYIITAIIRDLTDRMQAEQDVRAAKEFLENIFSTSTDAIFVTDEKGSITMANDAMVRMTGYTENELLSMHSSNLGPEDKDSRDKTYKAVQQLYSQGVVCGFETIILHKQQRPISVEINMTLLHDRDKTVIGGVNFIRDVTEKKKLESILLQNEKLKSLGELAGGVAHDFNNVLAAILGRVQLLERSLDGISASSIPQKIMQDIRNGMEIIEKAALDGAETVRRVREFSRRTDDGSDFETLSINEIIDDAVAYTSMKWKTLAETRGITFDFKKKLTSVPAVSGNASELREVFTNIINNAIDAMPRGGTIEITSYSDDKNVTVTLHDSGIGISQSIQNKIFDPFFTTKGVQCSGLGLSVSFGILNRHHGNISVESSEGAGTTFNISLPATAAIPLETTAKDTAPITADKALILVIDDESDVRDVLFDILVSDEHVVMTAPDGKSGIRLFKEKSFDLVFTDLGMPEMSGWQVAKKIKKLNKQTPVALITGWEIEIDDKDAAPKGVDFIINKPFQFNQVLKLVRDGMKLRKRLKNQKTTGAARPGRRKETSHATPAKVIKSG